MADKIFLNIPTRLVYCGYKKQNKQEKQHAAHLLTLSWPSHVYISVKYVIISSVNGLTIVILMKIRVIKLLFTTMSKTLRCFVVTTWA